MSVVKGDRLTSRDMRYLRRIPSFWTTREVADAIEVLIGRMMYRYVSVRVFTDSGAHVGGGV